MSNAIATKGIENLINTRKWAAFKVNKWFVVVIEETDKNSQRANKKKKHRRRKACLIKNSVLVLKCFCSTLITSIHSTLFMTEIRLNKRKVKRIQNLRHKRGNTKPWKKIEPKSIDRHQFGNIDFVYLFYDIWRKSLTIFFTLWKTHELFILHAIPWLQINWRWEKKSECSIWRYYSVAAVFDSIYLWCAIWLLHNQENR